MARSKRRRRRSGRPASPSATASGSPKEPSGADPGVEKPPESPTEGAEPTDTDSPQASSPASIVNALRARVDADVVRVDVFDTLRGETRYLFKEVFD